MKKAPDAFRTISEVSEWLETPAHVLRFWESKFSQIKPVKRAGGRRYYRPDDMRLLGGIKQMLHVDGLTIKGAQKVLREKGIKHVVGLSPDVTEPRAALDGAAKSDIDALTDEITKNVAEVAKAPAKPLVLDPSNIAPPAPEPVPEVRFDSTDIEQPVVFATEATEPDPQIDGAETMDNTDTRPDGGANQANDASPALDTATPTPKSEEISELYGRLKSLRRHMRDSE